MVNTVRAKFKVHSVTHVEGAEIIEASPVTTGSEENKSFSKYTPSGSLKLHITNEDIFGFYKPSMEFYVDMMPAESPA